MVLARFKSLSRSRKITMYAVLRFATIVVLCLLPIPGVFANLLQIPTSSGGSGIAFHAAADLGNVNPGTSLTTSYTVGSGSNRLLIVSVIGDVLDGADDCGSGGGGATYNGVAMTLRNKNGTPGAATNNRITYLFELLAPASGSNNVVVTCATSHFIAAEAADYSGVVADDSTSGASTPSGVPQPSITLPITTVATGSWVMTIITGDANGSYQNTGSPTVTMTQRIIDVAFHTYAILDSAGPVAPGAQTIILQQNGVSVGDYVGITASYHP